MGLDFVCGFQAVKGFVYTFIVGKIKPTIPEYVDDVTSVFALIQSFQPITENLWAIGVIGPLHYLNSILVQLGYVGYDFFSPNNLLLGTSHILTPFCRRAFFIPPIDNMIIPKLYNFVNTFSNFSFFPLAFITSLCYNASVLLYVGGLPYLFPPSTAPGFIPPWRFFVLLDAFRMAA